MTRSNEMVVRAHDPMLDVKGLKSLTQQKQYRTKFEINWDFKIPIHWEKITEHHSGLSML